MHAVVQNGDEGSVPETGFEKKVENYTCFTWRILYRIIYLSPPSMRLALSTLGSLGLVVFLLPSSISAADYSPCASVQGAQEKYQCRRAQAMTHVRQLNMEFRRDSRPTILAVQQEYGKDLKRHYLEYGKLSAAERRAYIQGIRDKRLASYLEWYAQEQELLQARRNLRKLTRIPGNRELRMTLIQEKGEFLDAKGNMKKTRRTIVEEQLEHLRSFRD